MNRITVSFIFISFFISACSDSSDNTQAQENSKVSSAVPSSQGSSCLAAFQPEPWTLLSLEEVAILADLPASEGTMSEPMKMKNLSFRAAGYKWDMGRTMLYSSEHGGERKIPVKDSVTVGSFSILDPEKIKGSFVDHFKNRHRNLNTEEKTQLDNALDEALEKESDVIKDVGKGFVGLASQVAYQDVDGIADVAIWQTNPLSPDGMLNVLHKNTTFVVVVNVNDDRDYNLGVAKKIALAIVQKCDA